MRAVISVVGKDSVGIIARVSSKCMEHNINIIDITQKVLDDLFTMIMLVDLQNKDISFEEFVKEMDELGQNMGLTIHTMHEQIFKSMHTI